MKKIILSLLTALMMTTSSSCDKPSTNLIYPGIDETDVSVSITTSNNASNTEANDPVDSFDIKSIPDYTTEPYVVVNNNIPFFTDDELTAESYELYSDFDEYGRCGSAIACLSKETMPAKNETRGEIGMIKPAGWHTIKYPDVISDLYLYNRCHLIGWQLSAENDNEYNLITGTRYLNVEGMLPFENKVDDYIEDTNNHVMYRVTPIYIDNELLCRGVLIEAQSIENNDCRFCVYCYNVQPGVEIDYLTGNSWLSGETPDDTYIETDMSYVLNTKSMKIHRPDCEHADKISEYNKSEYNGDITVLFDKGYTSCGTCKP